MMATGRVGVHHCPSAKGGHPGNRNRRQIFLPCYSPLDPLTIRVYTLLCQEEPCINENKGGLLLIY